MAAMIASAEVRPMPLAISTSCSARLPARSLHVASRRCGGSSSTSSVRGLRPPRSAALEDPPSPSFPESSSSSVAVEHVAYEGGAFSATGRLITHADPDAVYQVLTNYEELARIFRNVVSSEVVLHPGTGAKQLVQDCRWQFLLFSGTFRSTFEVSEDPASRSMAFTAESSFMRRFVGRWEVGGRPCGGATVRHHLTVQPSLSPPQKVGDLSKQIFVGQVESILQDLADELDSCVPMTSDEFL